MGFLTSCTIEAPLGSDVIIGRGMCAEPVDYAHINFFGNMKADACERWIPLWRVMIVTQQQVKELRMRVLMARQGNVARMRMMYAPELATMAEALRLAEQLGAVVLAHARRAAFAARAMLAGVTVLRAPDTTRIDRWLCAVRLVKTRPTATQLCDAGHVLVNGNTAKPSTKVRAGDRVDALIAGRDSKEPQLSLSSGLPLIEKSVITQAELQYRTGFFDGKPVKTRVV